MYDYKIKDIYLNFYLKEKNVAQFNVKFDVKPKDIYGEWQSGNGKNKGDWIVDKNFYFDIVKINEEYQIKNVGTGPSVISDYIEQVKQ